MWEKILISILIDIILQQLPMASLYSVQNNNKID